ncbi:NfeD family protein [Halopelagius longus]|uniref:Membrane protein implicated in regulation of membrane protease activity n=1 Tax=Halopelagius longus TaxID=1236180 RepID=A0A1H1D592_9EURY|nr:NfeD family protein [Halopelagius longus]RDI71178.1 NfeD family protein [Halopelagius longus]SDQ71725.1 Membrane protein implicated in regulation of membrane protease activity [Halopelagius longus]
MLWSSLSLLQFSIGPEALPLLLVTAGLGLTLAEAFAPGAHFIVLGIALLAAGLVGLVLGPLAGPVVLGVLVLVFGALSLYGYRELDIYGGKGTGQTSDSTSLRGKTGRVTERVTPTGGEIKLLEGGGFNPYYAARSVSGEMDEGTEVIIVDPGGGNVVTVESLEAPQDEIDRELARGRARTERDAGVESETERT